MKMSKLSAIDSVLHAYRHNVFCLVTRTPFSSVGYWLSTSDEVVDFGVDLMAAFEQIAFSGHVALSSFEKDDRQQVFKELEFVLSITAHWAIPGTWGKQRVSFPLYDCSEGPKYQLLPGTLQEFKAESMKLFHNR